MANRSTFRLLLWKTLAWLVLAALLVALCYFVVDREVARYVYDQGFASHYALKWVTLPPPILQAWAPAVIAALMIRRVWGPLHRCERALLAACVAIIVADQFRESLSYVFGRYWPETWIDNNPSFIRDGAYGFHPFHSGSAYGSFPSGHSTRILAVASVLWIAYPKLRLACGLVSVAEALGLIGMNYHFVGDVIAGGFVGAIVGAWTYTFVQESDLSSGVS
ncbi:MAG TPA: phosphatase PAP2 family protein [Gemmataceae bacterium]|nr:phosphatase PAP2 family protein [Gemmataceae bacterium]